MAKYFTNHRTQVSAFVGTLLSSNKIDAGR